MLNRFGGRAGGNGDELTRIFGGEEVVAVLAPPLVDRLFEILGRLLVVSEHMDKLAIDFQADEADGAAVGRGEDAAVRPGCP